MAENIVPADLITANDKTPLKNLSYGTNTKGTTKVTLYAIWDAIEYNLTYDLNDISDTQAPVNPSENDIRTYTVEDYFVPKDPTMLGYTFTGWTGSNGDTPSNVTVPRGTTEDKSYKANWVANTYTVTYDYNDDTEHGSLPSNQEATFDEVVTFATNDLTKDEETVHHTKVAQIIFDANGGFATTDETSVATEYDMGTQYEANGWTYPLYNGGTNHGTSAKNMTSVDRDTVTLKPYWNLIVNSVEPALTCYTTLTGESGGTQVTAEKEVLHTKELYNGIYSGKFYQYRDKVTTYTFQGWYTSATGGSKVTSFNAPSGSGDDNSITYYAHYTEAVTYDYSVYPSNGTVIYPPDSKSYGTYDKGRSMGPGSLTGATATGTTTASDAGSYTAYYTPLTNYCWADGSRTVKTVTWTIDRASISKPTKKTYTYNGNTQGPGTLSGASASGTTTATAAGDYEVTYTPDNNHCWSDGTYGRYEFSWSISKASQNFTVSPTTINIAPTETATITVSGTTYGTISYKSSSTTKATVSGSGKTGTVTGKAEGTVTITVTAAGDANHESASKTVTVNVAKKDQNITVTPTLKTIKVGESFDIKVTNAKGSVSYTTSSSAKATVSGSGNTGTVTGKAAGSATITVTAAATDIYNAATERVSVTVEEDPVQKENGFFIKAKRMYTAKKADGSYGTEYDYLLSNDSPYIGNVTAPYTYAKMNNTNSEAYNIYNQSGGYAGSGWSLRGTPTVRIDGNETLVYRYFGKAKDDPLGYGGTNIHAYKKGAIWYYVGATSSVCQTSSTMPISTSGLANGQSAETGKSIWTDSSTFGTSVFN